MRLLLAEDEIDLAEALAVYLEKNQFIVDIAYNGEDAAELAASGLYDGIILDIMMPRLNGIEALKRIRKDGCTVPVMMLTAKGEKEDRILGFDSGADDYIPKPFEPDELLSRLKAMLRRGGEYKPSILKAGDLELNCDSGIISCGNKNERLSSKEFQLLELMMRSPNAVFSADTIMEKVWGWDTESEINVVWVHISNLRKKISGIGSAVTIKAIRGIGYSLRTEG